MASNEGNCSLGETNAEQAYKKAQSLIKLPDGSVVSTQLQSRTAMSASTEPSGRGSVYDDNMKQLRDNRRGLMGDKDFIKPSRRGAVYDEGIKRLSKDKGYSVKIRDPRNSLDPDDDDDDDASDSERSDHSWSFSERNDTRDTGARIREPHESDDEYYDDYPWPNPNRNDTRYANARTSEPRRNQSTSEQDSGENQAKKSVHRNSTQVSKRRFQGSKREF